MGYWWSVKVSSFYPVIIESLVLSSYNPCVTNIVKFSSLRSDLSWPKRMLSGACVIEDVIGIYLMWTSTRDHLYDLSIADVVPLRLPSVSFIFLNDYPSPLLYHWLYSDLKLLLSCLPCICYTLRLDRPFFCNTCFPLSNPMWLIYFSSENKLEVLDSNLDFFDFALVWFLGFI